ncbi:MAG TPA: hypothetical protein DDZ51_15540 [Planctomycetaceae bacterium]|nr:hypothetical protein [Planctomycetaceae bacterium]
MPIRGQRTCGACVLPPVSETSSDLHGGIAPATRLVERSNQRSQLAMRTTRTMRMDVDGTSEAERRCRPMLAV